LKTPLVHSLLWKRLNVPEKKDFAKPVSVLADDAVIFPPDAVNGKSFGGTRRAKVL
jgi:hypothetical protein